MSWFNEFCKEEGIKKEESPPYQPEQNPFSERSGAIIIKKSRSLILDSNLPDYLWPEAINAAIYIINRTPIRSLGWVTPHEALYIKLSENQRPSTMKQKPDISNLRIYGCKTYARITKIPRLQKLKPRALIGYLVSYIASNIWRIWIPNKQKVINARDCIFDETSKYETNQSELINDNNPNQPIEPLTTEKFNQIIQDFEYDLENEEDQFQNTNQTNPLYIKERNLEELPLTPLPTPPMVIINNQSFNQDDYSTYESEDSDITMEDAEELTDQTIDSNINSNIIQTSTNQIDSTIDSNINVSKIIPFKRTRSPSPESSSKRQHQSYLSIQPFLCAFSAAILKNIKNIHRDNLPDPPKTWRDVQNHPYKEGFMLAAEEEYQKLNQKKTWVPISKELIQNHQILPLLWVFTYKFDENGYLSKFKARICVRGDLQIMTINDTRATTLAARTLRTLLALMAAFDLESMQYDAINAFINSEIDEDVYIEYPPGYN
jgi:hypothetical protein